MVQYKRVLQATVTALSVALAVEARADIAPPPDSSNWVFTGAAYLWGSGIDGEVGAFGLAPQDIDVSFSDILSNLDMAFMGLGEARNGPFSIGMDVAYAKLGITVDTPFGIVADDIDVTVKTLMATGILGYALIDTGTVHLDAIAGARLWSVDNDFGVNSGGVEIASFSDGGTWVDPLVGTKFRADLGSDFYASGWGMIGGFGISSDLMWDAMAGIGYEFTESFSVFGGYRAVSVDYSDDGFVYDVVQQGPIFAGVFRFWG